LLPHELLEVSMIHSVAGLLANGALTPHRPFRAPHHSASMPALVGGGLHARPGEASLAHHGVLFLDELAEFQPQVLDSLRQPLESGEIIIARANHRIAYPARFQLIAAMNPCRCGRALEAGYACKRAPNDKCMAQYQARLSGPFLDRMDLRLDVPAVRASDLLAHQPSEPSHAVAKRVSSARQRQKRRYEQLGQQSLTTNAQCPTALMTDIIRADQAGLSLLNQAASQKHLTARSYHRLLKVARTIADLDDSETVSRPHIAEALSYRSDSLSGAD
jgi:magnesium chelatase family protein